MRARGEAGALRVGYQVAADLGAWEMVLAQRLPRAYLFRAVVTREHPYWITQEPLDLSLTVATVEWLWRGVTVTRDGAYVTVELAERPIVSERSQTTNVTR